MAGILDQKTRTLDFVITAEGKRELAKSGQFVPEYISFGDDAVYYEKLSTTGSIANDASTKLSFEAHSFERDAIFQLSGSVPEITKLTFNAKYRSEQLLLNLQKLRIIQSIPSYLIDETEFKTSKNSITFTPEEKDIDVSITSDISNLSAIFQDKHFQHIKNYKYLPPINSITKTPIGDYPKFNTDEILTDVQLQKDLQFKKFETLEIKGGIQPLNIMFRILEENEPTKNTNLLELIDYGKYVTSDNDQKHVLFAGKIFEDQDDIPVFVNIFTLVFS